MAFEKLPEGQKTENLKAQLDALRMQVAPEKEGMSSLARFKLAGEMAAMSADNPDQLEKNVNSKEVAKNDRAKIGWFKKASALLLSKHPENDTTNPLDIINDKHDQAA